MLRLSKLILAFTVLAFTLALTAGQPVLNVVSSIESTNDRLTPQKPIPFSTKPGSGDVLSYFPQLHYQSILAFGGAITEAASVTWLKLPQALQDEVIQSYYNATSGNGYNWGRIPMNSCDFVDEQYNFDNVTDDFTLSQFDTKVTHDSKNIIPMVQAAQKVTGVAGLRLFATPWSPPGWMKGNGQMDGSSNPCLKTDPRYAQAWAQYYIKFFDAYKTYGIPFWGMTIQNEPENNGAWESCTYTPQQQVDFWLTYLKPALDARYPDLKVLAYDHNKNHAMDWAMAFFSNKSAHDSIWGLAIHWYSGDNFENVRQIHDSWPEKPVMATEACNCGGPQYGQEGWRRAETYVHDILGDLNAFVKGWTDWNILLDQRGGPNHLGNFCDAPIIANLDKTPITLTYQDTYYAMGTFSRFLSPGSIRIGHQYSGGTAPVEFATFLVNVSSDSQESWTKKLAHERDEKFRLKASTQEIVTVILNTDSTAHSFQIQAGQYWATINVPAHSFHTVSFDASIINDMTAVYADEL